MYIHPKKTELTTRESAYILGKSPDTITKYVRDGLIIARLNSSGNWMIDRNYLLSIKDAVKNKRNLMSAANMINKKNVEGHGSGN